MKYEVKVTQVRKSDTSDYEYTDSVIFTFANSDDMHTFVNLVSLNSEKTTIEIKFKEDNENGLEL